MSHRVPLRWQDVDGLGHVGHTAVLGLLEEGRDAFLEARGVDRRDYVVGRCEIVYRREILLEQGHVGVSCAVVELGRTSLTTSEQLLDPAGEVLVEGAFGLVLWDRERRAPRPITQRERAALAPAEEAGP
jgi:acyl-CoA thioester hydrolase